MKMIIIFMLIFMLMFSCTWIKKHENQELVIRLGITILELMTYYNAVEMNIQSSERGDMKRAFFVPETNQIFIFENGINTEIISNEN